MHLGPKCIWGVTPIQNTVGIFSIALHNPFQYRNRNNDNIVTNPSTYIPYGCIAQFKPTGQPGQRQTDIDIGNAE